VVLQVQSAQFDMPVSVYTYREVWWNLMVVVELVVELVVQGSCKGERSSWMWSIPRHTKAIIAQSLIFVLEISQSRHHHVGASSN
jgi:hypothetical protein